MAAHHSSITYEDGSLYEGTLHPQSGLPHGEGMMKFSDGSVYSGQCLLIFTPLLELVDRTPCQAISVAGEY